MADEAIERYLKTLQTDPTLAELHNNLGLPYMLQGEFNRAMEAFKTAIELDGGEDPQTNLGLVYSWLGRYDEAIGLHKEALDMAPDIGIIYSHQGRPDEAVIAHKKAGAMAEARNNLGIAYYQQGERDAAIDAFNAPIDAEELEEARTNLSMVTAGLENIEATELYASPIGAAVGDPAAWCEIVD